METDRLQWHDGFQAALQIEFQGEAAHLEFYSELELYKKPLRIDTLVVKRFDDTLIQKNIGRIFRKYNLIEYKSPDDYLNINDFYKVYAYACLFQSNTDKVHDISMKDVTITFVCSHYPRKMLKFLKQERGIEVERIEKGIYRLNGDSVSMQILLTNRLSPSENRWLNSLRRDLPMNQNTERLLKEYNRHKESKVYQAAMDLIMRANQGMMKEDCGMVCDALKEIFADEWKEKADEWKEKELQMQQWQTQMQEKETQMQEKEIQMQEKETQMQEKETQMQEREMRLGERESRMNFLIQRLLHDNLIDDLRRAVEDKAYMEQMYQRYGL